jgi:hypothetical protein
MGNKYLPHLGFPPWLRGGPLGSRIEWRRLFCGAGRCRASVLLLRGTVFFFCSRVSVVWLHVQYIYANGRGRRTRVDGESHLQRFHMRSE